MTGRNSGHEFVENGGKKREGRTEKKKDSILPGEKNKIIQETGYKYHGVFPMQTRCFSNANPSQWLDYKTHDSILPVEKRKI